MRTIGTALFISIIFICVDSVYSQNIEFLGRYDDPHGISNVAIAGGYAYAVAYGRNLQIIDVSDPSQPVLFDSLSVYSADDIAMAGNYAYIAGRHIALTIVDISDPANPIVMGSCDTSVYASSIALQGSYAYLGTTSSSDPPAFCELRIADISNPNAPFITGSCTFLGMPRGIGVSGDYVCMADYTTNPKIINVSDPANPVVIDSCAMPSLAHGIYVSGNYSYIADGVAGLQIVDISNPTNPTLVGHYSTNGHATDAFVRDNIAYLADYQFRLLDVSNPANPTLITSCTGAPHLYVKDDYIYLCGNTSLIILRNHPTGIGGDNPAPSSFSLSPNYPNPFNASTSIRYSLSKSGPVNLSIYNLLGQKVATKSDGIQQGGEHSVLWNANDFTSGVYFVRLESDKKSKTSKMILLK